MQLLILLPILSQLFYVTKSERVSHELVANYTCPGSFQSKLAANPNSVANIFAYFESTHPNYTCIGSFQSNLAANLMHLLILLPILSQLFYVTKLERISHELVANYTCLGSFQSKLAANFNAVAHSIAYFESTHSNPS